MEEAIKLIRERGNDPAEIQVFSADALIKKLGIEVKIPENYGVALLYGLRVVEKEWMPKNKAVMVDTTGKVIRVFDM